MMEAIAAALILGGINTLGDFLTLTLELQTRPAYALVRTCLVGYCIGAIVGMRARQIMLGAVCGLVVGVLAGAAYQLLTPALGWSALLVAGPLFWIGFALVDTLLHGDAAVTGAMGRGIGAAAMCGVFFYALAAGWPEPTTKDPSFLRLMVVWSGAFLPGFVLLFLKRL